MAQKRYSRTYRCRKPGYVWLAGPLLDQMLEWLTNIRLPNGGSVTYDPNGISLSIPPPLPGSAAPILVKLTGGKDMSGYYVGDVYANGTDEASTAQDVSIALRGFDVNINDSQGWYLATLLSGETDVFEVVGQTPIPPTTGTYFLQSADGVLSWMEAGNCEGSTGA